jgi:hypothetical protein
LWGLSAFFALAAILISLIDGMIESYILIIAVVIWLALFGLFFKTKDA